MLDKATDSNMGKISKPDQPGTNLRGHFKAYQSIGFDHRTIHMVVAALTLSTT